MTSLPQLRLRTEFSFRKAYGSAEAVCARLVEIGCMSAGIVDGSTWGHVRWEKALSKAGVQPLFGAEAAIDKEGKKPVAWYLAEDLAQFYRFSSSTPKLEEDFIGAKGVIRFAGAALTDPDAFDYVDLNPLSVRQSRIGLELARHTGRDIVLTSDNNFPSLSDRDRFLALNDSKKTSPQHILDDQELRAAFWFLSDDVFAAARKATFEVAERLQGLKLRKAPIIKVPGDLPAMVAEGLAYRLSAGHIKDWTPEYEQRLQRELAMITEKDFASYFVVVSDLVAWAKKKMLVGPARGSSAGSLVCYLLRITEVDPIVHDLLFERFIDINRNDLPDIDIDFNDQKRELCFDYLIEKYGRDNVSRIGSINTLKPRSVMAEVGKKMAIPAGQTFAVLNVLIEYSSGDSRYGKGLEDTLTTTGPGKKFSTDFPEAMVMGDVEGHAWHTGQHAAGIIVSNEPVTEYCTVREGIAQLDKPDTEYLNLLKIDALGLRTLGVLEDSGCLSNEEFYALTPDDPEVFRIFNEGKFSGLFQFEGSAQRRVSMQVPIDAFDKIDHVTALARPGPLGGGASNHYINRNFGREEVTFRHPSMEKYLGSTFGVVLYQEQVMKIVREIGQFSWEETSAIRKAMSGRKGTEYFAQRGKKFVEGAAAQGIDADTAAEIWNEICSFGAWGMNRCTKFDTRIKLAHPNQFLGPEPTIEELYNYYKVNPSSWVRQRKAMPVLLCVGGDGVARPQMAVDIHKTGVKPCFRYGLSDGRDVECTPDHKFIVNGEWKRIGDAAIGDKLSVVARDHSSASPLQCRPAGKKNGRIVAERAFKRSMEGVCCQDCGGLTARMEAHHNDLVHGRERPADLAWLCSSCHKLRHKAAGDWDAPYARGWKPTEGATILSIENVGDQETYDIEMPAPNHNYVLANGVVTHNSHTVSYAMISYWCAFMKRYHPVEYAAACLRNAKDEEQTVEILRELSAEGVGFVPFDIERSEQNWSAKDGMLVGGFTNLHGVGMIKAAGYVDKRNNGTLTEKDKAKIAAFPVKNADLRPAHTMWQDIYSNPDKYNIHGHVREFSTLQNRENVVVVCKLLRKERRDENETVRLARRGGERKEGQTQFLDLFVVDDSVSKPIIMRIKTKLWSVYGEKLAGRAIDNRDWFLVRGTWLAQFSMLTAEKVKCLTNPGIFNEEA